MNKKNVVIIGAGIGGLLCGAILAKNGYLVKVLDKNKQIGGSLQSFGVDGKLFESAVHYIGSLQKGQTLYKIFNYLDLIEKISLKRLDIDCFDKIIIDQKEYCMAQGYENFINTLAVDFPHQKANLTKYIQEIKTVCAHFPLYNMRLGSVNEKKKVAYYGLKQKLDELISDEKLKQILAGNNMLYASEQSTTPFYIHALIENSYIESSWKCELGSIQIAKGLQNIITEHGGSVDRNTEIISIHETEGVIDSVMTSEGMKIEADFFISNLHPAVTYNMLDSKIVKKATKKRITATANTPAAFMINISLEKEKIPYKNYNTYYHRKPNVWLDLQYASDELPNSYGIFYYQDKKNKPFARGLSILTYMNAEVFEKWKNTLHTTSHTAERGKSYLDKKNKMAKNFIKEVEKIIPGLQEAVKEIDICTPLTYRDYLNIPDGSMYGLKKDVNDLANTTFSTRTKIPNLFLTGQNINMHGILGVSITALLTVSELMGLERLLELIDSKD